MPHHYCYEVTAIPLHELHRSEWMHCSYKNPDKLVHVLSEIFVGFIMTQHYDSPQNIVNLRVCSKPVEPSNVVIWLSFFSSYNKSGLCPPPLFSQRKVQQPCNIYEEVQDSSSTGPVKLNELEAIFFPSVFMFREPSMWCWFRLLKERLFQAVLYEETHYLCKFRRPL